MDNKINKMLIDATHPEETRVVVLRNGRVEEFDYESAARKLLRGNIYLAKVTRVEPSLQAAFIEYGGNRHGFLAFSEIHPDYYQIPVSDRQALIDEEAAAEAEADAEADARAERKFQGNGGGRRRDGQRDGGGRQGGRNGNRQHGNRTADDGAEQPAGTGDQLGLDQPDQASTQIHETAGDHHTGGEAAATQHDHATPTTDAVDAEGRAMPEATDTPAHIARAERTGHDDARITEAYAPDDTTADHQHGTHDHAGHDHDGHDHAAHEGDAHLADRGGHAEHDPLSHDRQSGDDRGGSSARRDDRGGDDHIEEVTEVNEAPEIIGTDDSGTEDDSGEDVQERPRRQRRRQYKIQEVIKRRQVILVQVVKEERGNKGAALTTYLSLAGRYTVLMPNTARGGGISRKITNPADRKRLKAIAQELDVPEGMGLIIRTAGAARTSQEIKRDYEYLLRLWESVRDMTLQSTAPSLVYEEGNLIKRSIRDLYTKEIDEVVVAGAQAYTDAHDFMRMLMPSHAKNVIQYNHPEALFTRYPIERQLNAMFSPYVTLKSGGYLVINQTEALVSIDVNSGKSTREYSIEETALATNLEASDEIARQLKLRDLAGLIVIDFIDMEEKRNNRKVEHRLTDALRFDRARIQVGRISHFGLMEMSRQRMRTGVLEGSTSQCPHCQGTGMIRSTESVALAVLRGLEDHLVKDPRSSVNVMTTATVALYILNNKRSFITDIERRYGIVVAVQSSDRMQGANFAIERSAAPVQTPRQTDRAAVSMDWGFEGEEAHAHDEHDHDHSHDERGAEGSLEVIEVDETGDDAQNGSEARGEGGEGSRSGRRRRRRRGRDRGDRPQAGANGNDGQSGQDGSQREARGNSGGDAGNVADHTDAAAPRQGFEADHGGAAAQPIDNLDGEGDEGGDASGTDAGRAGAAGQDAAGQDGERGARRGRRRGRRGGRRGRENRDETPNADGTMDGTADGSTDDTVPGAGQPLGATADLDTADGDLASTGQPQSAEQTPVPIEAAPTPVEKPAREPRREPRRERAGTDWALEPVQVREHAGAVAEQSRPAPEHVAPQSSAGVVAAVSTLASTDTTVTAPVIKPLPGPRATEPVAVTQIPEAADDPSRPRRRGWWQRRGLGE